MAGNNATDKIEDGQRKQVHSDNGIRSFSLMGSNKEQGQVGTGNMSNKFFKNRKRRRSATKQKKAKTKSSYRNKHSKSKGRYRSTTSSSLTKTYSPSPKREE